MDKKQKQQGEGSSEEDEESKKKAAQQGSDDAEESDDDEDEDLSPEDRLSEMVKKRDYWRKKFRKVEARLKAAEDKARKFDELEAQNKSDTQKLADRQVEDKKRDAELLRLRVGMRKGLTEPQIKRLVGDTEEDLEADADELLKTFKVAEEEDELGNTRQRLPKPNLRTRTHRTGAQGSDKDPELSKDEIGKIVDRAMASKY